MRQPCRGVAQLVAHLVWDQGVGSSNLSAPTTLISVISITYKISTQPRLLGCPTLSPTIA